jgi:hypoxanthine-guanine phosphoribosyltransferase
LIKKPVRKIGFPFFFEIIKISEYESHAAIEDIIKHHDSEGYQIKGKRVLSGV